MKVIHENGKGKSKSKLFVMLYYDNLAACLKNILTLGIGSKTTQKVFMKHSL